MLMKRMCKIYLSVSSAAQLEQVWTDLTLLGRFQHNIDPF